MRSPTDKVSFGFRAVSAEEKKKLVHDTFTPIAGTYDRANALLSLGLRNLAHLDQGLWEIHRILRPGGRLAAAGFTDVAFRPLTFGIAVVYLGRKPQEVPHAADRQ